MASPVATSHKPLIDIAIPSRGTARWATLVALAVAGTIVLWASAKVAVPFFPVPVSLQTLAVMLVGAVYGWRLGLATVLLYLAEGAFGLPVFANTPPAAAGPLYLLGTTGGFLVGFAIAAAVIGWFVERGADRSALTLAPVMLLGDAIIFVFGWLWLAQFAFLSSGGHGIGLATAFTAGVAPFLIGDLVKVAIASLAVPAANRLFDR